MLRLDAQNIQITPEDRLTVLCEITIDGKDTQQSGQNQVTPGLLSLSLSQTISQMKPRSIKKVCAEKLSSDFNFLLESGTFSDVTIKCDGIELSCHKVILGARSGILTI